MSQGWDVGQPWVLGEAIRRIPRCSSLAAPSREPERGACGIWGLGFSLLSDLGEERGKGRGFFLLQCLQHLLPA